MRKALLIIFFMLFTVFISGCSLMKPVTELVKPPKLSQEQIDVDNALKGAIGTRSINLKYPRSGSYRSAFVFYDIDEDGIDECIVFYQPGVEDSGVRINILDYTDSTGWKSVYDVPGRGSGDIDFITFENIQSKDYKNIVIGWRPQKNSKDKIITIYRYENRKLPVVFEEKYNHSVIYDFNKDGLNELMLLSLRTHTIMYVGGQSGEVSALDEVALSRDVQSIEQLLCGELPDGRTALYIDLKLDGADYATEIFTLRGNLLSPLINISSVYTGDGEEVTPEQQANFALTQRIEPIMSADINGDGYIEVPSSLIMLGYDERPEDERRYLTTYSVYRGGAMLPAVSASVNLGAGYLIKMPESWTDKVIVVAESDMSWQFIKYNGNINDRSVELLRVSRVLKNDYQDRFSKDSVLLGQKGLYSFYGYIPPTGETELNITNEDMKNMFLLL